MFKLAGLLIVVPIATLAAMAEMAGAAADFQKSFVTIRPGQELYVEYRAAEFGQPTLFLLNGLTYNTDNWSSLVLELDKIHPGLGIVLHDMEGMGHTWLQRSPLSQQIPMDQQTLNLRDLVQTLKIPGRSILAGLSYGGGVATNYAATFPNDFSDVILMAPYMAPIQEYVEQLERAVANHRLFFPFDPRPDDRIYDYYLKHMIYSAFSAVLFEHPLKLEGIFRLIQGSKTWNAFARVAHLRGTPIHLMTATQDEIVKQDHLEEFWQRIPAHARTSQLVMHETQHKIPEVQPHVTAHWIQYIIKRDPRLYDGHTFVITPSEGDARSRVGNITLPLPKTRDCDAGLAAGMPTAI